MLLTIRYNNATYADVTDEEAIAHGIPNDLIDAAVTEHESLMQRNLMRKNISSNAGDNASLIGTTADAAALAIACLAEVTTALSTATTLAEVRDAAAPIAATFAPLLAAREAGDVVLTCDQKGREAVLAEVGERSTAVTKVLAEAATDD